MFATWLCQAYFYPENKTAKEKKKIPIAELDNDDKDDRNPRPVLVESRKDKLKKVSEVPINFSL